MSGASTRKSSVRVRVLILSVVAVVVLALLGVYAFAHANKQTGQTVVKVAIASESNQPIWDQVNKNLADAGENIVVKTVALDGPSGQPNEALNAGEVDLNAFQHQAYLNSQIKAKGYKFSVLTNTYISPLNVYSDKISSIDDLKDGDTVLIPKDPTNAGRALQVLESAGLITTDPSKGYSPTVTDITKNPKNLKIEEVDAAQVLSLLPDSAAGITNAAYVLDAGKDPNKDSIYKVPVDDFTSKYNKPWLNVLVSRAEDKDNPVYQKIVKAYTTKSVADVILKEFHNSIIPVFKY